MGQEIEEMPKVVVQAAFPPCINALYADAAQAHHLRHIGRFTLTSFLVNIGMTPEGLNELFKTFSDYNERLTRYQIEHIAGERGSGTKYTCPQCSVLQTHGVCKNRDELCRRIYHPLAYYKRKQKTMTQASDLIRFIRSLTLAIGWQDSLMAYQLIGNPRFNSEVGVILPTYGEADNIAKLIDDIENLNLNVSILVIDDSSPDGTAEMVLQKQNTVYQHHACMLDPKKTGLGTAITDGFKIFLSAQTAKIRFHDGR